MSRGAKVQQIAGLKSSVISATIEFGKKKIYRRTEFITAANQ